ncbi:DoxX family protein [soil metagenome]
MQTSHLKKFDRSFIHLLRKISLPLSRFAIFLIYFWFGILKVVGASPASPMVLSLLSKTMPFMSPGLFLMMFGLFEVFIGIAFLVPGLERVAILLLCIHLITTILPLYFLPELAWSSPFVPTLEGQYIIKNILIAALGVGIASHLHPIYQNRS